MARPIEVQTVIIARNKFAFQEWCHADPPFSWNSYKMGENYGYPCLVDIGLSNCVFCGKSFNVREFLD